MAKKKSTTFDSALLKKLCEIQAASGHEKALKDFLLHYINKEKKKWKNNVEIIEGEHLQDCFLLKFGKPRTAIFAHHKLGRGSGSCRTAAGRLAPLAIRGRI